MKITKTKIAFLAIMMAIIANGAYADNITYVLAARKADLFKTQGRVADMVANVNTTGFKGEHDVYGELARRMDDGNKLSFSNIETTKRDFSQGSIVTTGRQLDIAINGPGLFMVETPRGNRYTRAGNFKVSAEGLLVTKENYPLVGPGGGFVEFAQGDSDIIIREDGLVSAGLQERGQIGLFIFENEHSLIREGNSLYRSDELPRTAEIEESKIAQGMLENSNVSSVISMTELIEVSRGIETTGKLMSGHHDLQMNFIRKITQQ